MTVGELYEKLKYVPHDGKVKISVEGLLKEATIFVAVTEGIVLR